MKISELMKRFGVIALALVMAMAVTACGSNSDGTEGITEDEGPTEIWEGPLATVMFASDYQEEVNFPSPKENLEGIIGAIHNDGKHPQGVVICGDYTNDLNNCDHQLSPEDNIKELKSVIYSEMHDVIPENVLFVQGNHDRYTESLATSGLHEFDEYLAYVVNTEEDFPWKQGKKNGSYDRVKRTSDDMKACFNELIEKGETRPVFITGHVPLHFTA
ncbi:MAG: metallophosphoesterase, partial [Eubacterium sp.]|nr:metallophosphoesterase [Candidatus Colimonas fimequi]